MKLSLICELEITIIEKQALINEHMLPKEKIRTLIGEAKTREALQLFLESIESGDNVSQSDLFNFKAVLRL